MFIFKANLKSWIVGVEKGDKIPVPPEFLYFKGFDYKLFFGEITTAREKDGVFLFPIPSNNFVNTPFCDFIKDVWFPEYLEAQTFLPTLYIIENLHIATKLHCYSYHKFPIPKCVPNDTYQRYAAMAT